MKNRVDVVKRFAGALCAAALTVALLPAVALGEISGPVQVIDGDSIQIGDATIRLYGVDAPEPGQMCMASDELWRCGEDAGFALAYMVGRAWVTCLDRGRDRDGRLLGLCYAGGVGGPELNSWVVSRGWALAYRAHTGDYLDEQRAAQRMSKGIWRGAFIAPWEWRRGKRLAAAAARENAPGTCFIKGDIGAEGERIYHLPGGALYSHAQIDAARGERWFCSEEEARAGGWRRAKR